MAQTYLEQRAEPLGNSFLECSENCFGSRDDALRNTWAMRKVPTSRLRRHHSIGGFVPHAFTRLARPGFALSSKDSSFTAAATDASDSEGSSTCFGRSCSGGSGGSTIEARDDSPQRQETVSMDSKDTKAPEQQSRSAKPQEKSMITTMMIRNLPHNFSQSRLLEELDKGGYAGTYDFAYLPMSFDAKQNCACKGYAFVNFVCEERAAAFADEWHKSRNCGVQGTVLNISPATLQGLQANVKKLAGPRMTRIRNPALRPFVNSRVTEQFNGGRKVEHCTTVDLSTTSPQRKSSGMKPGSVRGPRRRATGQLGSW